jgi:hypothetical protein
MDSKTALSELKNFQGTRKSSSDLFSQAQGELGVGDARTQQSNLQDIIRNTEKQLAGVGESVAGRTRGNLVTEAQRARLQNLEERPIAQSLGSQQGAYSDAAQNYRDLLGQATQQAGMMYQSDADRQSALEGNYNRLFGQETAAQEQARWQAQQAENMRQFNEQMAATERKYQSDLAEQQANRAQTASLYDRTLADTKASKEATDREAAIQAEAAKIAATPVPESTGGGITIYDKLNAFKAAPLQTKIGSLLPLSAEYAWKRGGDLFNNIGKWLSGN